MLFKSRFDSLGCKFNGKTLDDYVNGKSFCCSGKNLDEIEQNGENTAENAKIEDNLYFYHPDHLGSTNLITNFDGEVTQSVAYVPYGEVFVEERNGSWATPFLFNAKELDEETGLYYYGARYLNPVDCRWLSVDKRFEEFGGKTPYNYCLNNPLVLTDPDGNYPKGILVPRDKDENSYALKSAAVHLLSLVSGVDELKISNAHIVKRAPGHYLPGYNSDEGGGAITLGNSSYTGIIIFTQNFFDDDRKSYEGHGYGQKPDEWLKLLSHEVGHLPQIDEHGNMWSYMESFGIDYIKHLGHDGVPREMMAEIGHKQLKSFNKYIEKKWGKNALWNLFNDNSLPQNYIKNKIDSWWKSYLKSNDYKTFQDEKAKILQEANQ